MRFELLVRVRLAAERAHKLHDGAVDERRLDLGRVFLALGKSWSPISTDAVLRKGINTTKWSGWKGVGWCVLGRSSSFDARTVSWWGVLSLNVRIVSMPSLPLTTTGLLYTYSRLSRIIFQYSVRLEPSESVSSSIISSYTQLLPLHESLLPCMPALADDGPDMVIHPSTKAFMARSVRRVFPLPLGPQKMSRSVCSPYCSKQWKKSSCMRRQSRPSTKQSAQRNACVREGPACKAEG